MEKIVSKILDGPIIIEGNEVMPGEETTIKIPVGKLPSDTRIHIFIHVYRSKNPGPIMLALGGVHGDEINGIQVVRQSIEREFYKDLKCGSVIAIPLLNVFGFINFSREVPDGKDINRSFPGNHKGSLASRVARTLTKKILPNVDFAIDFHTGGSSRFNYPQIRYSKTDPLAMQLAHAFAPPYIIQKALIPKSFRRAAKDMGIPVIVYEGGESIRLDGFAISNGLEGLKRVMVAQGMINDQSPAQTERRFLFKRTGWIRAPYSGIFVWARKSGMVVNKGEPLGVLKDPYGMKSVNVNANRDGYIIGHNNASVVNQGDALFHIGFEYEEIS